MSTDGSTFQRWDGTPRGGILTTTEGSLTTVRLEGDIDLAMAEEFGQLLLSLPTTSTQIVLDVAGLRFCDSTLVNFVSAMHRHLPVTVAPPNRWVVELLRVVGLADKVSFLDAP